MFLLSYLVLINSHENFKGAGGYARSVKQQSCFVVLKNHKFLNSVNRFPKLKFITLVKLSSV